MRPGLEWVVARTRDVLLVLASISLAGVPSPASAAAPGLTRLTLPVTGSYALVYVPYSLDLAQPAPAVVFLHGSGAYPEGWEPILAPIAEDLGFVLVVPRAQTDLDFGIGADDTVIDEALRLAEGVVSIDRRRIGLAGHSAGGAYALVLAYGSPSRFDGVFALSAPYRTVIQLANPAHPPPIHFWYGSLDPNYAQGQYLALREMFDRLGVPNELELGVGHGHSDVPDASLRAGFAFLLAQPASSCVPGPTALCLRGRFRVEASWQTATVSASAGVVQLTDASGYLWFFAPDNVEVSVKLLDGCALNHRQWVFASGTTDVHVTLTATDTVTGDQVTYGSPSGTPFQPVLDTSAFAACP